MRIPCYPGRMGVIAQFLHTLQNILVLILNVKFLKRNIGKHCDFSTAMVILSFVIQTIAKKKIDYRINEHVNLNITILDQ